MIGCSTVVEQVVCQHYELEIWQNDDIDSAAMHFETVACAITVQFVHNWSKKARNIS